MVLGTFLHTVCMPAYKVTKVAGPRNHASWPDQASNGAVIFYDAGFSAKFRSCRFVTS